MGDKNQNQTQDINQLLQVRREKLANLQQAGKDPFQITKFNQTHHSMEAKKLYEAHEAELLKDHREPDVSGMDEEQAKEALKADYEERRAIMDAHPLHVAIAGRMMFKRVMWQEIPSAKTLMQTLRKQILAIFTDWRALYSVQEQARSLSMQRR